MPKIKFPEGTSGGSIYVFDQFDKYSWQENAWDAFLSAEEKAAAYGAAPRSAEISVGDSSAETSSTEESQTGLIDGFMSSLAQESDRSSKSNDDEDEDFWEASGEINLPAGKTFSLHPNDNLDPKLWAPMQDLAAAFHLPFGADFSQEQAEQLALLPRLKMLYLSGCEQLSAAHIQGLSKLRSLEWLDLSMSSIDDDSMKIIAQLPNLKHLDVGSTAVTDAGVKELGKKYNLVSLGLEEIEVSEEGLHAIRRSAASLRSLNLLGSPVSGRGVDHLLAASGLETLNLSFSEIPEEAIRHFGQFAGLLQLDLSYCKFNGSGLSGLPAKLQLLDLSQSLEDDANITALCRLSELRELSIGSNKLSTISLSGILKAMPRLHCLDIRATNIDDELGRVISNLKDLLILHVSGTQIGKPFLSHIKELPKLECLDLGETRIGDPDLDVLSALPALGILTLSESAITDRGVGLLSQCKKLYSLNLSGTKITDDCIDALTAIPQLSSVDLNRTRITPSGIEKLRATKKIPSISYTPAAKTNVHAPAPKSEPQKEGQSGLGQFVKKLFGRG